MHRHRRPSAPSIRTILIFAAVFAGGISAFAASLSAAPSAAPAPPSGPPAPSTRPATARTEARPMEQIVGDLSTAAREVNSSVEGVAVLFDPAKRQEAAPKALPVMRRMAALIDEMAVA